MYRSARGHRTRSTSRNTFATGVLGERDSLCHVAQMGTNVNEKATSRRPATARRQGATDAAITSRSFVSIRAIADIPNAPSKRRF